MRKNDVEGNPTFNQGRWGKIKWTKMRNETCGKFKSKGKPKEQAMSMRLEWQVTWSWLE